ncbi:MAG: 3-isopropylmalate dehydrogenase [Candidatus Micrarchaeota archaeon]
MVKKTIAVLPGDGIGPETTYEAIKVLDTISKIYQHEFNVEYADFGGIAYDKHGHPFPEETKKICDRADAILKGPVGAPQYDNIPDVNLRPERGAILPLRARYQTYANLRPIILPKALKRISPLKPELIPNGVDIMMVRELVGGLYFGEKKQGIVNNERYSMDAMHYTEGQVERIARFAFEVARKRNKTLHNIHKSNVILTCVFWNEIVDRVSKDYPDVKLMHMLVDNAAYKLVVNPTQFDTMLLENMFGDILSDEGGGIIGSLGLLPSACIGPRKSYFEPSHGSAPHRTGQNTANPYSMIGSTALMLEYAFGLEKESKAIWNAMFSVLNLGYCTNDLAEDNTQKEKIIGTREFGDMVVDKLNL